MAESHQPTGYLGAERTGSLHFPGYLGAEKTESRQSIGCLPVELRKFPRATLILIANQLLVGNIMSANSKFYYKRDDVQLTVTPTAKTVITSRRLNTSQFTALLYVCTVMITSIR